MNLIKSKTMSRLTDLNLKNCLLLSVTDLSPDIQKLARSKQSKITLIKGKDYIFC